MTHACSVAVRVASSVTLLTLALAGCSASSHGTTTAPVSRSSVPASSPPPAGSSTADSSAAGVSCAAPGSSARVSVASARDLKSALAHPQPGEEIVLAPGTYAGNFTVSHSGTSTAPANSNASRSPSPPNSKSPRSPTAK